MGGAHRQHQLRQQTHEYHARQVERVGLVATMSHAPLRADATEGVQLGAP